jgi:hypothetical protein
MNTLLAVVIVIILIIIFIALISATAPVNSGKGYQYSDPSVNKQLIPNPVPVPSQPVNQGDNSTLPGNFLQNRVAQFLSGEETILILAEQNKLRINLGLPPLKWSDRIEETAQDQSSTLAFRNTLLPTKYAESIFSGPDDSHISTVINLDQEKSYYNTASCDPSTICSRYWNVINEKYTEIGCGKSISNSVQYVVCDYN